MGYFNFGSKDIIPQVVNSAIKQTSFKRDQAIAITYSSTHVLALTLILT